MLVDSLLARVGLDRLRLPVPGAKLAVIQAAAHAIGDETVGPMMWQAYLDWLADLELESEVAEALCIALLLKGSPILSVGHIHGAIARPSALSDELLRALTGRPPLVTAWITRHSGELPPFFTGTEELTELQSARTTPPILQTRLQGLQRMSGKPFLKQWAYEFRRTIERLGPFSDGQWTYYATDDRHRGVGQFITRRGHAARSAYLRTLALATDMWGMPEKLARLESFFASPADLAFLRMAPASIPNWASPISTARPEGKAEWETLINGLASHPGGNRSRKVLVHLHTSLPHDRTYRGEVELVTILYTGPEPAAEEAFRVHQFLPGRVAIPRTRDSTFILERRSAREALPSATADRLLPALLPCVIDSVGYLHADLLGRMPYLPANYSTDLSPIGTPRVGGVDIEHNGLKLGELSYWNLQWAPTYDRDLGPGCGVSTVLTDEALQELFAPAEATLLRVWRAKVLNRNSDYGEWVETVHWGRIVG